MLSVDTVRDMLLLAMDTSVHVLYLPVVVVVSDYDSIIL